MRKTLAWLRRHPFAVFAMLTVGAGAGAWLYVQTPSHLDREHFNEIKMGMTVGEVERILGGLAPLPSLQFRPVSCDNERVERAFHFIASERAT